MQVQAAPLLKWEAASFQRESPLRTVMVGGCTRGRRSVAGTTSTVPGWIWFGSEMLGLEARSSFQREPLPRWRRASFQRESPGWIWTRAASGVVQAGETGAGRGARDGGAGSGLDGRSKFGAAVGSVVWTLGECGAASESENEGFAGAERSGERGARSLERSGEKG